MDKSNNCFSENNFDKVYKYINEQINVTGTAYYLYSGYEVYLSNPVEIRLKKNNYTLAVIHKQKAIFSLAIKQGNSNAIVKEANNVFCKILLLAAPVD
jgi:hypothetical protein